MLKDSALTPSTASLREIIPAGAYRVRGIAHDQIFRSTDREGTQAADTLCFNAEDPAERYSAVDTIPLQGNVYLSCGSKLRSTEGNVLLEIVADQVGRHDTLGGA